MCRLTLGPFFFFFFFFLVFPGKSANFIQFRRVTAMIRGMCGPKRLSMSAFDRFAECLATCPDTPIAMYM
jgi:hypothetical protein